MPVDAETREMLLAFVDESREVIAETEPLLMELEQQADADTVQAIFRMFHSMKGSAGFLELVHIQGVTHDAETLLQRIRDGELPMDAQRVDVLCNALDIISARLATVETQFHDDDDVEAAQAVRAMLQAAADGDGVGEEEGRHSDDEAVDSEALVPSEEDELLGLLDEAEACLFALADGDRDALLYEAGDFLDRAAALATDRIAPSEQVCRTAAKALRLCTGAGEDGDAIVVMVVDAVDVLRELVGAVPDHADMALAAMQLGAGIGRAMEALPEKTPRLGEILVARGHATVEEVDRARQLQHKGEPLGKVLIEQVGVPRAAVEAALEAQKPEAAKKPVKAPTSDKSAPTQPVKRHETLRVDVTKLDALMDLVGELIIGTTAVIHNPAISELGVEGFDKSAAQLDRITRSLQDVAMSLRMTPVEKTFRRMSRLVRDVAHKRGRQVQFVVEGEDTEVDKSVAEIISDPLVHILRNAVDHGIESPEDRLAAGKDPEGSIVLTARHQGGEVWVTVVDDGRGLDKEAIYRKAAERGLTDQPLSELPDRDVFGFVFAPGFSTAEVVSDISGRGVGMDVARRNLESVNGRVDVASVAGKGTTVTLRIPLTLAIIEGMLVRVGEAWFTVPMLQVQESVRVQDDALTVLHTGQEMVRIRDRLLPVLRLHQLYRIDDAHHHIPDGLLVVVEDDGESFCLFVDELIGQRQTVIKSLSGFVGNLNGLSGCTVLGDGRISLILDVAELYHRNLSSRAHSA